MATVTGEDVVVTATPPVAEGLGNDAAAVAESLAARIAGDEALASARPSGTASMRWRRGAADRPAGGPRRASRASWANHLGTRRGVRRRGARRRGARRRGRFLRA